MYHQTRSRPHLMRIKSSYLSSTEHRTRFGADKIRIIQITVITFKKYPEKDGTQPQFAAIFLLFLKTKNRLFINRQSTKKIHQNNTQILGMFLQSLKGFSGNIIEQ